MSFVKFLTSWKFIKHLLLAFAIIFVIIIVTMQALKFYTRHGEANPILDFEGLSISEAMETAKQQNLKIEIIDSLYISDSAPGTVVDQFPEKQHKVKKGRTIFLTINSTQPELVSLPLLTDISFRQAQVVIENSGLKIGRISYQPSEYNDLVLKVQIDSVDIVVGEKLPKGASIDLIVGRQQGNQNTPLPDLKGLSIEQAENKLTDAMLNKGVTIYDESVISHEDSINAVIWQQRPSPKITGTVNLGSSVDIWVTVDQLKIEEANEQGF